METKDPPQKNFVFPRWTNRLPLITAVGVVLGLGGFTVLAWYYGSPKYKDVGYSPKQPVPYSHKRHAGDMQIDCRYCHSSVEKSAVAMVPPTKTCMNCHEQIKKESPNLAYLKTRHSQDLPVEWVRIHKIPDHAYFNHSSHVSRGVGCVDCHGRVDQMVQVKQEQPLSMGWCLDCHRNPAPHLRPVADVTHMDWKPPASETADSYGQKLMKEYQKAGLPIRPPTYCSGCHR